MDYGQGNLTIQNVREVLQKLGMDLSAANLVWEKYAHLNGPRELEQALTSSLAEVRLSKTRLKRLVREALRTEASALGQVGDQGVIYDPTQGEPSAEGLLKASVMDAVDLLKAGNADAALGQLEAVLDAVTGTGKLDK